MRGSVALMTTEVERTMNVVARNARCPQRGLDICCSLIDRRVSDVLLTVRVGAVVTCAALARRIGQPDALYAVADACATNPFVTSLPGERFVRVPTF